MTYSQTTSVAMITSLMNISRKIGAA